jgi:hypothetical protein
MTEIVVAYRDGILTAPNGEKFRLVRGKTLADARHPGVRMRPESWGPVVVELSVDEPEAEGSEPDARIDELIAELAEANSERDRFGGYLSAIAEALAERGLVPAEGTDQQGWLVAAVVAGLDRGTTGDVVPEEGGSVRPPRGARPRKQAKPAAVAPASEVDPEDEGDDLA